MNILVVGGGGREHAIVRKLKESPKATKLYCAPGNGGIAMDAECVPIKATDVDGIVAFASTHAIDLVVVTPDDPLMLGMVDALEAAGIRAFGPVQKAALIEGSKVFSKDLMKKYGIPTAGYHVFSDPKKALEFIREQDTYPTVIKADGLALGKGVIIAENYAHAKEAIQTIMTDKVFGASGNTVVIEEFLTGPEVSVLCFTDGKTIVPMVSAKDHKRAFDGDLGPNTGGMGTVSDNPFYTKEIADICMERIFKPTIDAMNKEGRPFKGCLFFGLMITKNGPVVIEYNARFGDPETQVVLPRLKSDLVDIFEAVIDEKLDQVPVEWEDCACACVVMASGGYPGKYETGIPIKGLGKDGQSPHATIFHAGTKLVDDKFVTAGGRVLGVTAKGATVQEALDAAYRAVDHIHFDGAHYRKDIGRTKPID